MRSCAPFSWGRGRVNALMLDAEPHPPYVELREAVDAVGGEGHTVVGADRARQAELPKSALEDRTGTVTFDVRPPLTGQQVPSVLIADREREAPHAIARGELALEVGRPEIVGHSRRRGNDAGVLMVASASAFLDQALAGEEIAGGTHRGPDVDLRMPGRKPVQQLAGTPIRMRSSGGAEQDRHLGTDAVRTVMRGVASVAQSATPLVVEPIEPLVAGLAADPVPGAEFGARIPAAPFVCDEAFALFHG